LPFCFTAWSDVSAARAEVARLARQIAARRILFMVFGSW
jgi:hypothetical protein